MYRKRWSVPCLPRGHNRSLCLILRRAGSIARRGFYVVAETPVGNRMTATGTNAIDFFIVILCSFYFSSLILICTVTEFGSFTDA